MAQDYRVLHSFAGPPNDGAKPEGGLVLDANGNLYGTTNSGGAFTNSGDCTVFGCGTVFQLDPAGNLTVLHSFSGRSDDGKGPVGSLIRDSAGNLYGTTQFGSSYPCQPAACGTVFRLDAQGRLTTLHSFAGPPNDGAYPVGSLLRDSAGNLYGTTQEGGIIKRYSCNTGCGVVFKLDPTGNLTILHKFDGLDGAVPQGSLIGDAAGNLYGTTNAGGAAGLGTVFKLDPSGTLTVLHSFTRAPTNGEFPLGVIGDASGSLYGTTNSGGAGGVGTLFKIDAAGNYSVVHSFLNGPKDGAYPQAGLLQDAAGNLYGTTFAGGNRGRGTVFKLDPAGNFTVIHNFQGPPNDGWNPAARLIGDPAGNRIYGTTFAGGSSPVNGGGGVIFQIAP